MIFTDEDLKRFKKLRCEELNADDVFISHELFNALLARLEAAEDFCIVCDQPRYSMTREQAALWNEWRKATGK